MSLPALRRVAAPTECCDRTPLRIDGEKVACRVCGIIWYDTEASIRRVFGDGVEREVVPVLREYRALSHDEYMALYDDGV